VPKAWTTAAAAIALILGTVEASAQEWNGFVTGGLEVTYRPLVDAVDYGPALARGGALLRLGKSRLWVGAQGDVLISPPYVTGRGGPIALVTIRQAGRSHVFAHGGWVFGPNAFGSNHQPVFGGGLNVWTGERRGLRIAVEDALHRSPGFCFGQSAECVPASLSHTLSGVIGIVWR
jgi:hypothetical protein